MKKMKCGYCDTEMKKGYIPATRGPLLFIPEGKKRTAFNWRPKDSIKISSWPSGSRSHAVSYYCPVCKIVVSKELID